MGKIFNITSIKRADYKEEEMCKRQKCREKRLKFSDRNCKNFYSSVEANRSRLHLNSKIRMAIINGRLLRRRKWPLSISRSSSQPRTLLMNLYFRVRDWSFRVMNKRLTCEVSKEEVKDAIFSVKEKSAQAEAAWQGFSFKSFGPPLERL